MQLTTRQDEVAKLVAQGMSNKMIARQLGISVGTVKLHMQSIFNRVGVRSRVMLAIQARDTRESQPAH